MTKRDFFTAIANNETLTAEIREYATAALSKMDETLSKRSSAQNAKKAAEYAPLMEQIAAILADGGLTTAEIAERCDLSTPKVSPICRKMVEVGRLKVEDVKVPKKGVQKKYSLVVDDTVAILVEE